ncbi:hypothetical protein [Blastopirellula retiformator]|uniref:Lipocalin-like domain-containing protein n=1 Tax=Blastopirellula retiformator TaxID=2527970 RepID=A0A5C5UW49_9BACT|nr:hypothetical protein [Blastopirellula retiformator]TWT30576.1 hypothetical protein Enr8_40970 [Blastopirellula retiformator]
MSDESSILGKWTIFKAFVAGRESKYLPGTNIVFNANHSWRQIDGVDTNSVRYDVHYSPKPYQIDIHLDDGINQGIFEFRDNLLVICSADEENTPRPTEFSSTAENGHSLVFHRRI